MKIMKIIECHVRITENYENHKIYQILTKILKIQEIDLRTSKIKKIIEIYVEDNENHENVRNPYENLKKTIKSKKSM